MLWSHYINYIIFNFPQFHYRIVCNTCISTYIFHRFSLNSIPPMPFCLSVIVPFFFLENLHHLTHRCQGGEKKRAEEENIREFSAQKVGRAMRERKERYILIEEVINGLLRNIMLGKFPWILKDDPANTQSNSGEEA